MWTSFAFTVGSGSAFTSSVNLKEGMEVHSINGQSIIINKSDKLSKDSRFGSTAYGFKKSQLRDVKLERILSE